MKLVYEIRRQPRTFSTPAARHANTILTATKTRRVYNTK